MTDAERIAELEGKLKAITDAVRELLEAAEGDIGTLRTQATERRYAKAVENLVWVTFGDRIQEPRMTPEEIEGLSSNREDAGFARR